MTFTKTTEYALKTLSFMATDEKKMFSSEELHQKLKVPKKYLQRLLTDLSKSGLIKSIRGRNGGYIFARSIKKIFLSEIIDSVEGFKHTPSCLFGLNECALDNPCAIHDLWSTSQMGLIKALSSTRLADLIMKKTSTSN